MTARVNGILLLALLVSALLLVKSSYEARRLFAALDKSRGEQRQLDIEHKRLEAERQAQATNLRVEKVARERLKMSAALPTVTESVADPKPKAVEP